MDLVDKLSEIKVELYKISKKQEEIQDKIERISQNFGMHILDHVPEIKSEELFNIFGRESIFETLDRIEERLKKLEEK